MCDVPLNSESTTAVAASADVIAVVAQKVATPAAVWDDNTGFQNEPVEVIDMSTRPDTREGVGAVSKNPPPPGRSGPRTTRGKLISSLNSLTHGLASKGFLRCKKDRCSFIDICWLQNTEEGSKIFSEVCFGDPCPLELAHYADSIEQLEHEGTGDDSWRHRWAMNEVKMIRRRMMTAVDQVCPGWPRLDRTDRYNSMLWHEQQRLLDTMASFTDERDNPLR